jgi:hypothetical protein
MESSATNFKLFFDIGESVPDFEQVCPLNLDYDQGESMDSWYNLCYGIMNNIKTGIDPTWSTSFKFDKSDPVCQFLIAKEFAIGSEATVAVRIVNLLKGTTGKQIDFTATISGISYSAVTEEVLNVSFDIKVADASTFEETDYSVSA